jgi:hypothetical protein
MAYVQVESHLPQLERPAFGNLDLLHPLQLLIVTYSPICGKYLHIKEVKSFNNDYIPSLHSAITENIRAYEEAKVEPKPATSSETVTLRMRPEKPRL